MRVDGYRRNVSGSNTPEDLKFAPAVVVVAAAAAAAAATVAYMHSDTTLQAYDRLHRIGQTREVFYRH